MNNFNQVSARWRLSTTLARARLPAFLRVHSIMTMLRQLSIFPFCPSLLPPPLAPLPCFLQFQQFFNGFPAPTQFGQGQAQQQQQGEVA